MPAKIVKAEEFKAGRMVYVVVDCPGVQHQPLVTEVLDATKKMLMANDAMRTLRMHEELDMIRIDLIPGPKARLTLKRRK